MMFTGKLFGALQNSPVTLSITSIRDNRYIDVNKTFERFTGFTRKEVIGRTPSDLGTWVDYSQRVALINRLSRERSIRDIEARFRSRNGQIWTGLSSLDLIEIDEEPCVLIATADITERKLVESDYTLSQRLIHKQEQERSRINCEVHRHIDDLILVAVYLDRFSQNVETGISRDPRELLGDVVGRLLDLSHRLYPAKLEYLGLAAAAASFCKELSEAQKKTIDFRCAGIPTEIPNDESLCLYRVLEEALQNATNHSRSQQFEVSLSVRAGKIELSVRDWGTGFDPAMAMKGPGLGLITMRERLKLVDGELSIESQPHGTTIHASVPMKKRGKATVVD